MVFAGEIWVLSLFFVRNSGMVFNGTPASLFARTEHQLYTKYKSPKLKKRFIFFFKPS